MNKHTRNAEMVRLEANEKKEKPLEEWGSYLSARQWGTVREDYSADGDAWNYFPHDHARSRVYKWGEDGIAGISDLHQNVCFSFSFWNGKDPFLKERLFGLGNSEGNHGEDVKELYYYLDNLPSHYYMKYLYKYPQAAFPYENLLEINAARNNHDPEYELLDTGIFDEDKYFDLLIEYAKNNSEDIFIKLTATNRGKEKSNLDILPVLWFRNKWHYKKEDLNKPSIKFLDNQSVVANHHLMGDQFLYFSPAEEVLFTENETNFEKLFDRPNESEFVKDDFHEAIIHGTKRQELRNKKNGTKCSPVYHFEIEPGQSKEIYLRLTNKKEETPFPKDFEKIFKIRKEEADEFYEHIQGTHTNVEQKNIQRQAFAGMLWNKQYYHYDVERWLNTSDGITPESEERRKGRNHEWKYLKNQDILSMPDNWEYPWYASWDTAFHCVTLAVIDPQFAKHQLTLLMREWYMDPRGQIPAYEWGFSAVNPPVHAFAAYQVYKIEERMYGKKDVGFLKRIFQKLIINFTWWTNQKDSDGNSVFEGGFLGLDNIGLFNRSAVLPEGMQLEQADGTSWMGMYALDMMNIALEIAVHDESFEDAATKFYEHFVIIAEALNEMGLWNEEDKFFYDVLSVNNSEPFPLKVRSIIGLSPLFAVAVIGQEVLNKLPDFTKRMKWFQDYRKTNNLYLPQKENSHNDSILFSLVSHDRLQDLLDKLLDESEFLSEGGIRSLSKFYDKNPYKTVYGKRKFSIQYDPGDSTSDMFGGNSNWRGPIWMPINHLLIISMKSFGDFYGDDFKVECPKGSGVYKNLTEVGLEITERLMNIFERNEDGNRPVHGKYNWFYKKPENEDLILFFEYFHGNNCSGLGASHQTGWTGLIANLILELKEKEFEGKKKVE